MIGVDPNQFAELSYGLSQLALTIKSIAQRVVSLCVVRVVSDRLLRLVNLPLNRKSTLEIVARGLEVRLQVNCLLKLGNGILELALLPQSYS